MNFHINLNRREEVTKFVHLNEVFNIYEKYNIVQYKRNYWSWKLHWNNRYKEYFSPSGHLQSIEWDPVHAPLLCIFLGATKKFRLHLAVVCATRKSGLDCRHKTSVRAGLNLVNSNFGLFHLWARVCAAGFPVYRTSDNKVFSFGWECVTSFCH